MTPDRDVIAWLDDRFIEDCRLLRLLRDRGTSAITNIPEAQARVAQIVTSHHSANTAPMYSFKTDHFSDEPESGTAWRPLASLDHIVSRMPITELTDDWRPELL